jgi:hypothetical protein
VRLHATILRWRVWVYGQVEAHPLWRALRRQLLQWRASMEARRGRNTRWERRLKAARRLDRMRRRAAHPSAG